MRCQLDVINIVAADVAEPLGKRLPARKMALEAGPAAVQRMPPHIDDLRVRQNEVNEPDITEILEGLVRKHRSAESSAARGHLQIFFAEGTKFVSCQSCHNAREGPDQSRAEFEPAVDPTFVRFSPRSEER